MGIRERQHDDTALYDEEAHLQNVRMKIWCIQAISNEDVTRDLGTQHNLSFSLRCSNTRLIRQTQYCVIRRKWSAKVLFCLSHMHDRATVQYREAINRNTVVSIFVAVVTLDISR